MNIKEQTVGLDERDESVDMMADLNEGNIATAVKETIDVPLETGGDETHHSNVVIPFRQRRKRVAEPENSRVETVEKVEETVSSEKETTEKDGQVAVAAPPKEWIKVKRKPLYDFIKRTFDIVLSALASVVLLIPVLIIALLIVIKDPGNPFYIQERVGKNHKPIKILKLRSMKMGADKLEDMLTPEQLEEYKREYKLRDDPRLIGWKKPGDGSKCFGARIRQLSLDEVMQIPYNILLKNDLRLIGPRPILKDELIENYTPEQQELLLSVKPGLTGYWQAYARNDATYEDGKRQQMELYYVQNRSLWLDVKIMFETVKAVLRKSGV